MPEVNNRQTSQSSDSATSLLASLQEQIKKGQEAGPEGDFAEQLAQARASRTQAEVARQQIANEILEATKSVCQKLIADGEETLERAKHMESEASQNHVKAQQELEQSQATRSAAEAYAEKLRSEAQQQSQTKLTEAQKIREEADSYRDRVVAEATQQGQEILQKARAAALQEAEDLKQEATLESQRILADAELIKAAAREEMEAQKIYAEAARLEAESREVLAQVRSKLEGKGLQVSNANEFTPVVDLMEDWQEPDHQEEPVAPPEETATEAEPKSGGRGSKNGRGSASHK